MMFSEDLYELSDELRTFVVYPLEKWTDRYSELVNGRHLQENMEHVITGEVIWVNTNAICVGWVNLGSGRSVDCIFNWEEVRSFA